MGGATVVLVKDLPIQVSDIALDASGVYWTSNGSVRKVPIDGGPMTTITMGEPGS